MEKGERGSEKRREDEGKRLTTVRTNMWKRTPYKMYCKERGERKNNS